MRLVPREEDFQQALESLSETTSIEFKSYSILSDKIVQSKLAQTICALCNSGGGWIILGRKDNGEFDEYITSKESSIDHDKINQISTAYLKPAPNCMVRWMKPSGSNLKYPVIYVPEFEDLPVFAIKNGPIDDKGKTIGVSKDKIYVRLAGPSSSPLENPVDFYSLIQKCQEKQSNEKLNNILKFLTENR